jgi:membrane protein
MLLDATPAPRPNDAARPRDDGREHPLLAAAAGMALVAIGFKLGLHVARKPRDDAVAVDRRSARDVDHDFASRDFASGVGLATRPSQVAHVGWKDILLRVYHDIDKNHLVSIAAGVTFYSILALFPAMAALVAVYGLFADPTAIATHLDTLSGVLPGGGLQVVGDELKRLTSQPGGTLGLTFAVGLATALWSANAGIKSLFDALNLAYSVPEKRGFIKLNAVSLAFTAVAIGFALLALAAMVVQPIVVDYLGVTNAADAAIRWLRWPVLLVVVMLGLAVLYRFGPNRADAIWRWVTWGSAVAAVLWLLVSALFSWYAAHFGSYDKTYGSLGAVIGFMIWIWISTLVVLLGAEIDNEMEQAERGTASSEVAGAAQE